MESVSKEELISVRGELYNCYYSEKNDARTLIFLHGFAGDHSEFSHFFDSFEPSYSVLAIDLLGHGKTSTPLNPERYESEQQIADLREIINHLNIKCPVLAGYSMGGRLALQYGVRYSNSLSGLVLESTSPGLTSISDIQKRLLQDKSLAQLIVQDFEQFVNSWDRKEVFGGGENLPDEMKNKLIERRKTQNPVGLANSLLGFGTGSMPAVHHCLAYTKCPVLLITGEKDSKFTNLARNMSAKFSNPVHKIVKDCAHRVHLEDADTYLRNLHDFLTSIH